MSQPKVINQKILFLKKETLKLHFFYKLRGLKTLLANIREGKSLKKYIVYLLIFLFGILILSGFNKLVLNKNELMDNETMNNTEEEIKQLENEILRLKEDISLKELDISRLKQERNYYREFIDNVLERLDENELKEILQKEWWYTLSIRYREENKENAVDFHFPQNGKVTLDKSDFDIILSEHTVPFSIIEDSMKYKNIFEQVLLKRPLSEHIKIKNYDNYEIEGATGTVVDSVLYKFSNVPKGTEIKVEISDELRQRLGINSKILLITIK